jgi:hypothetical protein
VCGGVGGGGGGGGGGGSKQLFQRFHSNLSVEAFYRNNLFFIVYVQRINPPIYIYIIKPTP